MNTIQANQLRYPFEEFADHMKAMTMVTSWEYTSRFGHLGTEQSSRAHAARVVEYFTDTYEDETTAVHKAEVFLSIYDYIGRHADLFSRKDLVERLANGPLAVDPALLRAVHHIFTSAPAPADVKPKKVLTLAMAFREIAPQI